MQKGISRMAGVSELVNRHVGSTESFRQESVFGDWGGECEKKKGGWWELLRIDSLVCPKKGEGKREVRRALWEKRKRGGGEGWCSGPCKLRENTGPCVLKRATDPVHVRGEKDRKPREGPGVVSRGKVPKMGGRGEGGKAGRVKKRAGCSGDENFGAKRRRS